MANKYDEAYLRRKIKGLKCQRAKLKKQLADAKAIADNLQIASLAAIEAFAEGVVTGSPTEAQIDAILGACGNIRRLLEKHGVAMPLGKGPATVQYLRDLADRCEQEVADIAAEAAKENEDD